MMSLREGRFNGQFASFRHVTSGETNGRHHVTHRNVDSCDWNDIARHRVDTIAQHCDRHQRKQTRPSAAAERIAWPANWPFSPSDHCQVDRRRLTIDYSRVSSTERINCRHTPRRVASRRETRPADCMQSLFGSRSISMQQLATSTSVCAANFNALVTLAGHGLFISLVRAVQISPGTTSVKTANIFKTQFIISLCSQYICFMLFKCTCSN